MLALTRKKGESIMIGDNIEVVVLGFAGEQIKLGVIAPREVSVHRKEIYVQLKDENKKAALSNKEAVGSLKSLVKKVEE